MNLYDVKTFLAVHFMSLSHFNQWLDDRKGQKKHDCMKIDWRNVNSKQSLMKLPIIEFRAAATESQATIDKLSIFQDFHRLNRFYSSRNVPSIVNKKSTIDEKKNNRSTC